MPSISPAPLPAGALLEAYAQSGAYTDCFTTELKGHVSHAAFVEAFYTSAIFKLERWLLAKLMARPSTDIQARGLAAGSLNDFAAWSVEGRAPNQVLLAAGRTRSWLMTAPLPGRSGATTRLYFGSAVVPRRGRAGLGWQFTALLGLHKLYSRVLLWAAQGRLGKLRAASAA
jgi:hypothetical protein